MRAAAVPNLKEASRAELDSNCDTCCFGKGVYIAEDTHTTIIICERVYTFSNLGESASYSFFYTNFQYYSYVSCAQMTSKIFPLQYFDHDACQANGSSYVTSSADCNYVPHHDNLCRRFSYGTTATRRPANSCGVVLVTIILMLHHAASSNASTLRQQQTGIHHPHKPPWPPPWETDPMSIPWYKSHGRPCNFPLEVTTFGRQGLATRDDDASDWVMSSCVMSSAWYCPCEQSSLTSSSVTPSLIESQRMRTVAQVGLSPKDSVQLSNPRCYGPPLQDLEESPPTSGYSSCHPSHASTLKRHVVGNSLQMPFNWPPIPLLHSTVLYPAESKPQPNNLPTRSHFGSRSMVNFASIRPATRCEWSTVVCVMPVTRNSTRRQSSLMAPTKSLAARASNGVTSTLTVEAEAPADAERSPASSESPVDTKPTAGIAPIVTARASSGGPTDSTLAAKPTSLSACATSASTAPASADTDGTPTIEAGSDAPSNAAVPTAGNDLIKLLDVGTNIPANSLDSVGASVAIKATTTAAASLVKPKASPTDAFASRTAELSNIETTQLMIAPMANREEVSAMEAQAINALASHVASTVGSNLAIVANAKSSFIPDASVDPGFPFRLTPMSFALRVTNSP